MKNIVYVFLLSIAFLASPFVNAQQNPAVLNPLISKTPLTGLGDQFDFSFAVGNNGSMTISGANEQNRMRFDLTLGKSKPYASSAISTIGTDAVSGSVLDFFDITYNPLLNTFTGIQKLNVPLAQLEMKQFIVHAVVTAESTDPMSAQIGGAVDVTPNVSSIGGQSEIDDEVSFFTYTLTILPLNALNLKAVVNFDKAYLEWEMISDASASYFSVEKSVDGINFISIGKVQIDASNNPLQRYTFTDPQFDKTSFYRIIVYDNAGKFRASNIEALAKNIVAGVGVFPNPATTFVAVSGLKDKQIIKFCDFKGAVLQIIKVATNTNYINLEGYSAGTYIIQVFDQDEIISNNKFIKQ
jgi:hypothetical protein